MPKLQKNHLPISVIGRQSSITRSRGATADSSVRACPHCGQLHRRTEIQPGQMLRCVRCGARMAARSRWGPGNALALALTALIIFVPAMMLPLIHLSAMGATSEGRIWDGAISLWQGGLPPVALLVALTSVLAPFMALVALVYILLPLELFGKLPPFSRPVMRALQAIQSWNMHDVYMLAILVAFIKLGQLATMSIGPGLIAFIALLLLSFTAWIAFEPDDIWNRINERNQP